MNGFCLLDTPIEIRTVKPNMDFAQRFWSIQSGLIISNGKIKLKLKPPHYSTRQLIKKTMPQLMAQSLREDEQVLANSKV